MSCLQPLNQGKIQRLRMNVQGVEIDDLGVMKDEVIRFFSTLYAEEVKDRSFINNLFSSCLEEERAAGLESFFFEEEVRRLFLAWTRTILWGSMVFPCFFIKNVEIF